MFPCSYRSLPRVIHSDRAAFVDAVLSGALTADELLRRYCTLVYAQTGSYQDTARRLGIDRRTARAKVDETWLGQLKAES